MTEDNNASFPEPPPQSDYSRIEYRSPPRCSCWCCLCNSIYCFIPICTGGSKDIIHTCPRCSYEIERYTRLANF
ncbi:unnamed protein product [Rhizophagus irregularis]|nr:unnamed protein product [Rhizophagus irregularis]